MCSSLRRGEVHLGLLVRARVVEACAVAARVLGAVHRGVGVAQQLAGVRAVVRVDRDADARCHEELVAVDDERSAHCAEQLLGHDPERFAVADPGQEDGEVVRAHARDRVSFADRAGQASTDSLQELVAHRVAEARVDLLEAVEVDHEHGELLPERASPLHGLVHAVFEEQLVRQAREAVVGGLVADLADEVGVLEGRRADGADRLEELDVGGVEAGHALAPADHEPLLVVVADREAHAALFFRRRCGADPRIPSVQKLLGRVRQGAGDVVRVDRGVDLLRSAQEAVQPFSIESSSQVLAEDDAHHDEGDEREEEGPRIGRRAQPCEDTDRDRAGPLQHARPESAPQVREEGHVLAHRDHEAHCELRDELHRDRSDDRSDDRARLDLTRRGGADEDEGHGADDDREHHLAEVEDELGEDRSAPQEAGSGAEQEHGHRPHRRQEEDSDDEVGLVEVHRLGFFVAQDAQRVGPPDRDRHREGEDHEGVAPPLARRERDGSDRRAEPSDAGARDDEAS